MPSAVAVAAPDTKANRKLKPGQRRDYRTISFAELEKKSSQIAAGIQKMGVPPGTRLALMVPPGIDFVAMVFGLFKAGMVIILIDPGIGRRNLIRCLADAIPAGLVGSTTAQIVRTAFAHKFPQCRHNIVVGRKYWFGCRSADEFLRLSPELFVRLDQTREQEAAIIFTTGSTGPPKGVLYRHRVFIEQARQIRDYFGIKPGTIDVSGFPLFALFNIAMGTTTVFPEMDATRPADVDPLNIKDAIEQFGADQSFGSPALWNTVSLYCEKHHLRFPGMKRILSAGAPVPPHVLARIKSIISPEGEAYTPYGATESLPVACISATEVLEQTAMMAGHGKGTCVGRKFPDMNWRVIGISDAPIFDIADATELATGEIGELIVRGDVVTDQYVTRFEANALHKIKDGDGFWHRMGDVGYIDQANRFWFCGRKNHRVQTAEGTLYSVACEGIFNSHPAVFRSALVGVGKAGNKTPVIVFQPWADKFPNRQRDQVLLIEELRSLAGRNKMTNRIKIFLIRKNLPVDIRHNSKIYREQLADWAAKKIPTRDFA